MRKPLTKFLLGTVSVLLLCGSAAIEYPDKQSAEHKAVQAFLLYCVPPIKAGQRTAASAEAEHMEKLSTKAADNYLNNQPGKVFALPKVGHDAVLVAWDTPTCAVMMKKANPQEMVRQLDSLLDPPVTGLKMQDTPSETMGQYGRQYSGKIGGTEMNLTAMIRMTPPPKQMQAVLTATRQGH